MPITQRNSKGKVNKVACAAVLGWHKEVHIIRYTTTTAFLSTRCHMMFYGLCGIYGQPEGKGNEPCRRLKGKRELNDQEVLHVLTGATPWYMMLFHVSPFFLFSQPTPFKY
jgi:hypothetical protein